MAVFICVLYFCVIGNILALMTWTSVHVLEVWGLLYCYTDLYVNTGLHSDDTIGIAEDECCRQRSREFTGSTSFVSNVPINRWVKTNVTVIVYQLMAKIYVFLHAGVVLFRVRTTWSVICFKPVCIKQYLVELDQEHLSRFPTRYCEVLLLHFIRFYPASLPVSTAILLSLIIPDKTAGVIINKYYISSL